MPEEGPEQSEIVESWKRLNRILGEQATAVLQDRLPVVLENRGVSPAQRAEKELMIVRRCLAKLEAVSMEDHPTEARRTLLLQAIGMTEANGAVLQVGVEMVIARLFDDGDIFPDQQSKDLFLKPGESLLEASIKDATLQLEFVLESKVVDALCKEIQKQSPQSPLLSWLAETNRVLKIYITELQLMAIDAPRDRAKRMELAQQMGLAENKGISGQLNMIGIEKNVQFAKEQGSVFPNKMVKAEIIKEG